MLQTPPDGGTRYAETDLSQLFPEPLNAITSAFFLGIAIFWTFRLRGNFREHAFLSYCLALLYIGGIGGTTYHTLRQWRIFIIMDWMPIMLLCISAGVYFLAKMLRWHIAALLVGVYIAFQVFFRKQLMFDNPQLFININYAMMAALVLLPVLAYLISTKWKGGSWVGIALVCFLIAITFRIADKWDWLSPGTHFLWHTFGAVACFCMFQFIYLTGAEKRSV